MSESDAVAPLDPRVRGALAHSVGAVVVTFNSGADVAHCVASLRSQGVGEIVVVDNGSRDDSLDSLPKGTVVVRNDANLGYGAAANIGARLVAPLHPLIVNPDVLFWPGALARLAAVLDDDSIGLVGPGQLDARGGRYPAARVFPSLVDGALHAALGRVWRGNPGTRRLRTQSYELGEPGDVDWVSGAAVLVRRTAWDDVAGFDPRYFLYFEDVDLCWRLNRRGWRVRYEPSATVVHSGAGSTSRRRSVSVVAHHRSAWRFVAATTTGWRRLLLPIVAAGLIARCGVELVLARLGRR